MGFLCRIVIMGKHYVDDSSIHLSLGVNTYVVGGKGNHGDG